MALVAIDLGTSNSVVARIDRDQKPVPVPNLNGSMTTPSAILFSKHGVLFGEAALNAAALEPDKLVRCWKREMEHGAPVFTDEAGKQHTAEDLSALFLDFLIKQASQRMGEAVTEIVVTVPSDAPAPSREATKRAAERCKVAVLGLVNEPTAAGVAYEFDKRGDAVLVVFDLGGGTLDATVLSVQSGKFRVLATGGDRKLGGSDFDRKMARVVLDAFQQQHGFTPDLVAEPLFAFELFDKVERAKIALSQTPRAGVTVTCNGKTVVVEFTQPQYEALIAAEVERAMATTEAVLKAAGKTWAEVTAVVPVGAASRTPLVQKRLKEVSGLPLKMDVEADLAVALGAAVCGWRLKSDKGEVLVVEGRPLPVPAVKVQEAVAHPLSVLVQDLRSGAVSAVEMIAAQTPIPAERVERFGVLYEDHPDVLISVVQGPNGAPPEKCVPIGELLLKDIPVQRGAGNRIEVRYQYDASGIIHVTVTDRVSGKSASTDLAWSGTKAA